MFSSIKTSEANKIRVTELTAKLQLGAENVIARLGIAYSLSRGEELDLKDTKDSKGKEYSTRVLFGEHLPFYVALVCQKYSLYKTNREIPRYIKLHLDDGLEIIHEEVISNPNLSGVDYLIDLIEKGLQFQLPEKR
jgi:DNA sulfur modification protein DndE